MAVYVNSFFEKRVRQLLDLAELVEKMFASAGIEYRIVGGLATYLYVEQQVPDAGRLTKDIDIAVRRDDLARIAAAAEPFGSAIAMSRAWICWCGRMSIQPGEPSS